MLGSDGTYSQHSCGTVITMGYMNRLTELYSLVIRFVAPHMSRTVHEPSEVERHDPFEDREIPRYPGVFVPQVHRQDCREYEGHNRHQNYVISGKIGDRAKP